MRYFQSDWATPKTSLKRPSSSITWISHFPSRRGTRRMPLPPVPTPGLTPAPGVGDGPHPPEDEARPGFEATKRLCVISLRMRQDTASRIVMRARAVERSELA